MSFQEIKSEPLGEEVEGVHEELNNDTIKRAEDISNICFDYEDEEKIPIKEEIKQEIKSEPLGEDVDEVHEESVENYDKSRDDKRPSSPPKLNRFDSDPPMPTLSTGNL